MKKGNNTKSIQETEITISEVLNYLKDNMVTKEDAKDFAKKEDLQNFVTKDDLKNELRNFATKDDLKNFATKSDFAKLRLDIIDRIDDKMTDIKSDAVILVREEDNKLISLVDILAKKSVIAKSDVKVISQMKPFPRLAV